MKNIALKFTQSQTIYNAEAGSCVARITEAE